MKTFGFRSGPMYQFWTMTDIYKSRSKLQSKYTVLDALGEEKGYKMFAFDLSFKYGGILSVTVLRW